MATITDEQYQILLAFRRALREYLRWSESAAHRVGLTPQQHQMLLTIRAHPGPVAPSIRDVAGYLGVRHHSAVGLVRRSLALGLLVRRRDEHDLRVVRLGLTEHAAQLLDELSAAHLAELQQVAALLHIPEQLLGELSEKFIGAVSPSAQ